jgi:hypothetical protein
MNNLKVTLAALRQKLAASRFDKEVRKGTLQYRDIDPAIPEGELPEFLVPAAKQRARKVMQATAAVDPETLTRRRALSDALFKSQLKATGGQLGAPGMTISETLHPLYGPATEKQLLDGVLSPHVKMDSRGGRFFRTSTRNPFMAVIGMQDSSLLSPSSEVDKTLNRALLQHEIGEAMALKSPTHVPHATHVGIEPQLLERLHTQGDPEAIAEMMRGRMNNPDDRHVASLIKQMGGTPDSPIPLDGRRARALKRTLLGDVNELSPVTRGRMLNDALFTGTAHLPQVPSQYRTLNMEYPKKLLGSALIMKNNPSMQSLRDLLNTLRSINPLKAYKKSGLNPEQLRNLRQALRSGKIPL